MTKVLDDYKRRGHKPFLSVLELELNWINRIADRLVHQRVRFLSDDNEKAKGRSSEV